MSKNEADYYFCIPLQYFRKPRPDSFILWKNQNHTKAQTSHKKHTKKGVKGIQSYYHNLNGFQQRGQYQLWNLLLMAETLFSSNKLLSATVNYTFLLRIANSWDLETPDILTWVFLVSWFFLAGKCEGTPFLNTFVIILFVFKILLDFQPSLFNFVRLRRSIRV